MEATLTSKGQVTIPKEIRDALGLRAGNRVNFILEKDDMLRLVLPGVSIATPLQPLELLGKGKRPFLRQCQGKRHNLAKARVVDVGVAMTDRYPLPSFAR